MRLLKLGLMGLIVGLAGCSRVNEDFSSSSDYAHVMGKHYRIKVDCGVYHYEGDRSISICPLTDRQIFPPVEKIKPPFPIKHYGTVLLGILPAGSEFKVVKVKHEGSTGSSWVHYLARITKTSEQKWIGKEVYLSGITTTEWVPQFKPEYVEQIPASQ